MMGNQPTVEVTIDTERDRHRAGGVTEVYYPSETVTEVTYPPTVEVTYPPTVEVSYPPTVEVNYPPTVEVNYPPIVEVNYPAGVTEVTYPSHTGTEIIYPAGAVGGGDRPEADVIITGNTTDVFVRDSEPYPSRTGGTYVVETSRSTDVFIDEDIDRTEYYGGSRESGPSVIITDNTPNWNEPTVVIEDRDDYVCETVEVFERSCSSSSSSDDDDY